MSHILTSQKWTTVAAIPGAEVVTTKEQLTGGECLIAFNTGVIVPADVLARYRRAYNFHAASPAFPGRDPHHWAVYEGAEWYGVTCHVMTERVDAGPIIAVEEFQITGWTPQEIRRYAEGRLLALFHLWAPRMIAGTVKPNGIRWGAKTRKRADVLALLKTECDEGEGHRRMSAFGDFLSQNHIGIGADRR